MCQDPRQKRLHAGSAGSLNVSDRPRFRFGTQVLTFFDTSTGTRPANGRSGNRNNHRQGDDRFFKLRHMFDEVVNEPVPDAFLEILRRADERSSGGSGE